jgi:hypothetical protein
MRGAQHWVYLAFALSLGMATLSLTIWSHWITFGRELSLALFRVAPGGLV